MSLRHESGEVLLECELSGAADGGGASAEQARQGLLQQLRQPQSAVRRHALLRQLRLDESDASFGGGPAAAAAMVALGPEAGRLASPLAPRGGGGGGVGGGGGGGGTPLRKGEQVYYLHSDGSRRPGTVVTVHTDEVHALSL